MKSNSSLNSKGSFICFICALSFDWLSHPSVQRLLEILNPPGEETRCVGGAIRNSLLSVWAKKPNAFPVKDIDFATTLLPHQVMDLLVTQGIPVLPIGIEHGTVRAILNNASYEITTLREDVETQGRWATVAFTRSWQQDASRRDFTCNALFLDKQGNLYDFFGGIEDLKAGRIRFIGDPKARIQEDFLRLLRFFRFSAHYGDGLLDAEGLEACLSLQDGLETLSRERITEEWMQLLRAPSPYAIISIMHHVGILPRILGFSLYTLSWLGSLLHLEKISHLSPNPLIRLAALMGAQNTLLPGLKLSRDQHKALKETAHALRSSLSSAEELFLFFQWIQQGHQDWMTLYTYLKVSQRHASLELFKQLQDQAQKLLAVVFPLTGKDLIQYGISPGPDLGRLLQEVQRWWLSQACEPSKEACLSILEKMKY